MHIAATNPVAIAPENVSEELKQKEMEIYKAQAAEMGKPQNMVDKIAEGKLVKFYKENCLLNQAYVRDPNLTIADLLNEMIGKIGENITIKRFCRYQLGES
jgi:elongation factor Ts